MAVNSVAVLPHLTYRATPRRYTNNRANTRQQRWLVAPVLVGVAVHTWALFTHAHGIAETLLMLAMTVTCLWCAAEIWMKPHRRAIVMVLAMSTAMMLAHTAMLLTPAADAGHAHHFANEVQAVPAAAAQTGMSEFDAAMLGIIAIEYGIAVCCALVLRRTRKCAKCRAEANTPA